MPASVKLSDTLNFCVPFVNWAAVAVGEAEEPFLTSANLALQTIGGPPFGWSWNRSKTTFLTDQGVQDYTIDIPTFGWLESASIQLCAEITSVTVTDGVAVYTAPNNFASLLSNGPVTTSITGCTTSALNGVQTIQSVNATSFTCNVVTGNLTESESDALALAGPIMPLEYKNEPITDAVEQDRPAYICELIQEFPPQGVLAVSKSHTGNFTNGGIGLHTVTVSNTGSIATTGTVTVVETPPSGLLLLSMSGSGWTITGNTATRSDVLAADSSYPPITVNVLVLTSSSPQVNTATGSGGGSAFSWNPSVATDSTIITAGCAAVTAVGPNGRFEVPNWANFSVGQTVQVSGTTYAGGIYNVIAPITYVGEIGSGIYGLILNRPQETALYNPFTSPISIVTYFNTSASSGSSSLSYTLTMEVGDIFLVSAICQPDTTGATTSLAITTNSGNVVVYNPTNGTGGNDYYAFCFAGSSQFLSCSGNASVTITATPNRTGAIWMSGVQLRGAVGITANYTDVLTSASSPVTSDLATPYPSTAIFGTAVGIGTGSIAPVNVSTPADNMTLLTGNANSGFAYLPSPSFDYSGTQYHSRRSQTSLASNTDMAACLWEITAAPAAGNYCTESNAMVCPALAEPSISGLAEECFASSPAEIAIPSATSPILPGQLLILNVWMESASSQPSVTSIQDPNGNDWLPAISPITYTDDLGHFNTQQVFYAISNGYITTNWNLKVNFTPSSLTGGEMAFAMFTNAGAPLTSATTTVSGSPSTIGLSLLTAADAVVVLCLGGIHTPESETFETLGPGADNFRVVNADDPAGIYAWCSPTSLSYVAPPGAYDPSASIITATNGSGSGALIAFSYVGP